jgi:phosphodiesterase/alkaline phosphatase D-like protein
MADSEHRGYSRLDITRERLQADLIAMDTVRTAKSTSKVLQSYVVASGKPGPVSA